MRAIVRPRYGSPAVLEYREVDDPVPGDDQVLVRVRAASVGAWDWHLLRADPFMMRLSGEGVRRPKRLVAGQDMAGTVEAIGASVSGFAPGDEVYGEGAGTFAELTCASPERLARKPANLTFEQAAAVPIAGATALIGLRDKGELRAGQRALIIGAGGGVGTFAVQVAAALGAEVTGVCSTASVALVQSLGADHVIDYTTSDLADGDARFDLIFQLAGTRSALELRRSLTPKGILVLSSGEGGRWFGPAGRLVTALSVAPFVSQKIRTFIAAATADHLSDLAELIEVGKVTPVIEKIFPLAETADAIRHIEAGHARGKTVVTVAL